MLLFFRLNVLPVAEDENTDQTDETEVYGYVILTSWCDPGAAS